MSDKVKKWVLVTGSAHRVGKAIAEEFVSMGYNLYLHYNSSITKAKETLKEFEKYNSEIRLLQANLSNLQEINSMMSEVEKDGLFCLVNSAAGFRKQNFINIKSEDFDEVININLRAPFLISQYAAKIMQKNSGNEKGVIINISDLSGLHPWKGYSHHGVSKAGLIHLTKSLAIELGPHIRVNAVTPGLILKPSEMKDETRWEEMMNNVPSKQSGNPKDVAKAAYHLVSNKFLNGVILPVDGGENLVGNINHV